MGDWPTIPVMEKKTVAVVAEVAIEISCREVALRSQALWGWALGN